MTPVIRRSSSGYQLPLRILLTTTVAVALYTAFCFATNATPASRPPPTSTPYRKVTNKVDKSAYLGWRVYRSVCYTCHGMDATGTSVAPDLVARVKTMSAKDFIAKVLARYRITLGYDEVASDDNTAVRQAFIEQIMKYEREALIMPAWEWDPNIKPHVLDLYVYLRARADGALGPGRPEQIES